MVKRSFAGFFSKSSDHTQEEVFEFIKDRALRLWHEAGKPEGNDWKFWFKAEADVKKQLKKVKKH